MINRFGLPTGPRAAVEAAVVAARYRETVELTPPWFAGRRAGAAGQVAHDRPQHRHQVIGDPLERDLGMVDGPERDRLGGADEDVRDRVELLGVGLAGPAGQLAQELGDQARLLGADGARRSRRTAPLAEQHDPGGALLVGEREERLDAGAQRALGSSACRTAAAISSNRRPRARSTHASSSPSLEPK